MTSACSPGWRAVFADLDLDVTQALVSTVGDRVVDVFYLRDDDGRPASPQRHAVDRCGRRC